MIGQTLSHYRIVEKIGAGGMGEVYKAYDEHLDRDMAVKVLPSGTLSDEHARKRFRTEAQALSKLNHPNIATVFDFDTQKGVDFIVMEYVEGASLAEKLKTGPLLEKEATRIGTQIAEALEEAHERGVVHRDLKPGNIAVTSKGRVKVLDFGLARILKPVSDEVTTEALTQEQAVAGTLPYMSPEELRGEKSDHRSDLFSFGVVLYEMTTGRRPFEHTVSTALADAIIHKPAEPPSTHNRKVSSALESIIVKALDKDPGHRYQSAQEMRVDLERLITPGSGVVPKRKSALTRRWAWVAGCVVVAMTAVFLLNVGGSRDALVGRSVPRIDSIAVLPLENLSGDPEQEYFADGMTETLITDLAKIGALKVISRTSVMRFKGTDQPMPEIAQTLGVDAVVVGSVLRVGDRVRITAQLIEAATDQHIWAESYERNLRDVLSLQSDVAQAIAQEIQIRLTPQEEIRLASTREVDPKAHKAYLKGRYYWNKRTPEGWWQAIEFFQRALRIDPNHAPAYSGLADSHVLLGVWGITYPNEAMPKAKAAAMKALELDETLAEAHTSLGFVRLTYDWDWSAAERELLRSIELNPGYATAHHWYAFYLAVAGRLEDGAVEMKRALELDPLSLAINAHFAAHLSYMGRYDEAIEQCQKTIELEPSFITYVHLWRAFWKKGMYKEALAAAKKGCTLMGLEDVAEAMERSYAESGYREAMQSAAQEWLEQSKRRYVSPVFVAALYVQAEREAQAIEWLERAYEEREPNLTLLRVVRFFDPIRDDPRFQDLLRRMNFPE